MTEECGMLSSLPPPYKRAGSGLGRPARPIQPPEVQGIRTDPLPQPETARFPACTACHPKRMEARLIYRAGPGRGIQGVHTP